MKANFDDYGLKLDPNFRSDVQLQAVSSLINEKPDILIVQNPTTTLLVRDKSGAQTAPYARVLRKAYSSSPSRPVWRNPLHREHSWR